MYVTLGVYAYGNHYGLTRRSSQFPQLSRYLNKFMENWSGGPFCRSTITVSLNNLVPMHRDVNNDENYKNHVVGLGNFQHGVYGSKSRELETRHRGPYMHDSFPMESGLKAGYMTLKGRWFSFLRSCGMSLRSGRVSDSLSLPTCHVERTE